MRRYLIGTPKSDLKKWSHELAEARDWQGVREGVEAKLCPGPEGEGTFLLCRSADRREKERAMHERSSKRIEERLASLARRLERSRRSLDREAIGRQIGRILGQNSRASGPYRIQVLDDPSRDGGLQLLWSVQPEWDTWAQHSEGTYILRTNVREWSSEELWRTYIQLTEAEAAFRIHKSDLSIRPIWHQKAERVQAHILVCFLAYVLWKTLEQWQRRAGLGHSPRTILEEIGPEHRRRAAPRRRARSRAPDPLRRAPGKGAGPAPRSAGPSAARAPPPAPHGARNVVPTREHKCPENLKTDP